MTIYLTGTLDARKDPARVRTSLPAHVAATLDEPGCLAFDVQEDVAYPGLFHVRERFSSRAAFDAHQERTRGSDWWHATCDFARDYVVTEA